MPPIRVCLIDDHRMVLEGLQRLLDRECDVTVVEASSDPENALERLRSTDIDVVVVSLRLTAVDGLEYLARARDAAPASLFVLLTPSITENEIVAALRLGVRGVVLKSMPSRLLVQCIRKVHGGEEWIERKATAHLVQRIARRGNSGDLQRMVSARELEVVRLVAEGRRNSEVAELLGLSPSTVKVHLHNIYEKLQVRDRIELTIRAREDGIV